MNYFEFRQWVESSVPWWVPFAVPVTILAIMGIRWLTLFIRAGRAKKSRE